MGITKNDALLRCIHVPIQWAQELAELGGEKVQECYQFFYDADT
jgi:hypothetical protein